MGWPPGHEPGAVAEPAVRLQPAPRPC